MKLHLIISAAFLLSTACTLTPNNSAPAAAAVIEPIEVGAVRLRLIADTDFNETTRYVSRSISKETELGKRTKTTKENVEFSVLAKIVSVDIEKERMKLSMKTIDKKGAGDLHDFALPEKDEEIIFEFDETARVYSAGRYPASSIFFVPPLPLPDYPVRVGESWAMEAEWINSSNSAPFHMHITSILKQVIRCGEYRCADVELSGHAKIIGVDETKFRFGSMIRGRYLFVIETGSVLWSLMRTDQTLTTTKVHAEVQNCFLSRLVEPKKMLWAPIKSKSCEPEEKIPADLLKAISL